MLSLECYEARLSEMARRHPEMPQQKVMLVRFAIFLQRRLEDHLAHVLAKQGLSHSGWSLLLLIHSAPTRAINPSAASEALRQSRPHMTRITDELVARGWVERVQDCTDRRAVVVRLTEAGERGVNELLPAMWGEYEGLLAGFSPEETAQLAGLLRKWLVDLETAGAGATALISDTEEAA